MQYSWRPSNNIWISCFVDLSLEPYAVLREMIFAWRHALAHAYNWFIHTKNVTFRQNNLLLILKIFMDNVRGIQQRHGHVTNRWFLEQKLFILFAPPHHEVWFCMDFRELNDGQTKWPEISIVTELNKGLSVLIIRYAHTIKLYSPSCQINKELQGVVTKLCYL